MVKLTPSEAREKHARRLKGATEDIRRGVASVNTAPGAQAALKVDKMRQKLLEAIDSGKWENGVKRVSLEEWKGKMVSKGIPRIAAGIDDAAGKVEDFYGQLFPYQDRIKAEIERLPDLTLEDSIQRMTTQIRRMAEFKRK